ncbi:MAG: zinc ribbon domain-containing protein [Thermoproteota archaeon]|nr:zinc ribbon domain-containing protein [Candidatus Brockarchaeota archaeon]
MVYCIKCGYKNPDEATVCAQCGAQLYPPPPQQAREYWRREDECFGIPRFGQIITIVFGVFLILMGVNLLLPAQYRIEVGPLFLILLGMLILLGALYSRRR